MVLAKLARASCRTRSTPIKRVTESPMERTVKATVKRRFTRLFQASPRIAIALRTPLGRDRRG